MNEPKTDKSVGFITLTNSGYFDYTSNLLKSLKRSGTAERLKIYCLDKECYEKFKRLGEDAVLCRLYEDKNLSAFQAFRGSDWHHLVANKFPIIHQNLLEHEYVLIVDGDIVFQSGKVIEYLLSGIGDNDLFIQNDGTTDNTKTPSVCSGFMFIRSNEKTLELLNPENIAKHIRKGWGDQKYIKRIIKDRKLKYDALPLELFPNGKYFYANHKRINPYIIHFNYAIGKHKRVVMLIYGKWFVGNMWCNKVMGFMLQRSDNWIVLVAMALRRAMIRALKIISGICRAA